jgi:hypothetical protein
LSGETLPLIRDNPIVWPLVTVLWTPDELAALPQTAAETDIYYNLTNVYTDWNIETTRAALMRDSFGLSARGGLQLWVVSLDYLKKLLEAGGFTRVEVPIDVWTDQGTGYVLDLRNRSTDEWIGRLIGEDDGVSLGSR